MTIQAEPVSSVVVRLGTIIEGLELDCGCRERVREALSRFADLEARRHARRELAEARHQRERIAAILVFLEELDEIASDEADTGVFQEIALLFRDVAEAAASGAEAMERLAGERA